MASVDRPLRLVVAGDGTQRQHIERLAEQLGVADRIDFLGTVGEERLVELYANALAVLYAPFDEDFGYVTLEAFLARRPVVTATDSGGPLEFVEDGLNGLVSEPRPEALGDTLNRLAADRAFAARLGEAGFDRARTITWDGVVEKLTETA
jgi:glycosyltransferase involved in cell wall biosynthesis